VLVRVVVGVLVGVFVGGTPVWVIVGVLVRVVVAVLVGVFVGVLVKVVVAVLVGVFVGGTAVSVVVNVLVGVFVGGTVVSVVVNVLVGVFVVGTAVMVVVSVLVGVFVGGTAVSVAVIVAVGKAQTNGVTLFVSSVTAPFRARALPARLAPVFMVILVNARIFPTNAEFVSIVAELPTCQNTLQPAPGRLFLKTTVELGAVVSVLPISKTQIALGSPRVSRIRVPVIAADDAK
jgi:hypothetical protein